MVAYLTHSEKDYFERLAIVISVLSMYSICEGIRCEGNYQGCCPGSSWNSVTQQCERCMPGYQGINCMMLCPYPQFGEDCQGICNCSINLCNISSGCIGLTTDDEMTATQPTIHPIQNFSLFVENNTLSMVKNKTDTNNQQQRTVNTKILMCIQIFGCVDIFLICVYFALCLYDRHHLTIGMETAYNNVPENNSTYENAEIFFLSATGNQL